MYNAKYLWLCRTNFYFMKPEDVLKYPVKCLLPECSKSHVEPNGADWPQNWPQSLASYPSGKKCLVGAAVHDNKTWKFTWRQVEDAVDGQMQGWICTQPLYSCEVSGRCLFALAIRSTILMKLPKLLAQELVAHGAYLKHHLQFPQSQFLIWDGEVSHSLLFTQPASKRPPPT